MQKLSQVNALQYAQEAAQREDWGEVLHHLQHWHTPRKVTSDDHLDNHLEVALALALHVLKQGEFQEQWDVAKLFPALGAIAIPALLALIQDEAIDSEVRWFAARILGEFRHPQVMSTLIEILQTTHRDDLSDVIATTLSGFGADAIAHLTPLLQSDRTRLLTVRTLCQMHHPHTCDALLEVVHDPNPHIRAMALESLSHFPDHRIPSLITAALTDTATPVRRVAVAALGLRTDLHPTLEVVSLLRLRLQDVQVDVACAAAIALGRVATPEAIAVLQAEAQAPLTPALLQVEIIRALGWLSTPASLAALRQLLLVPNPLAPAQAGLVQEAVREAIAALGRTSDHPLKPVAVQTLADLLPSPVAAGAELKQAIASELGILGHPSAIPALVQLLAEEDLGVRLHAIAALKKLKAGDHLLMLSQTANLSPALAHGIRLALSEWATVP